jgi:Xaa-Pro aminopeptidase
MATHWSCSEVSPNVCKSYHDIYESSENAALPHGSGTDRKLGKHDFALFDTGATLHGYASDVTRVRHTLLTAAYQCFDQPRF